MKDNKEKENIKTEIDELSKKLEKLEKEAKDQGLTPDCDITYDGVVKRLHFLQMKIGELKWDENFMEHCQHVEGWY